MYIHDLLNNMDIFITDMKKLGVKVKITITIEQTTFTKETPQ